MILLRCLGAIVALAATAAPQQNQPSVPVTIGSGAIIGTVTDERTGIPISSVTVTIAGTTRPPEREVTTDSAGAFVFSRIAGGTYTISAKRSGYFDGEFGQRQPLGAGAALTVEDGERRTGVRIALVKPGAVTGTVRDEAGEPVVKLAVRAYVRQYFGGRAFYAEFGSVLTDDRGMYRIGRLPAGDFVVGVPVTRPRAESDDRTSAMPRDGGALLELPPGGNGKSQIFPASYFPAGVAAPFATPVSIGFSETRRNVDLQVRPAPAFRVTGNVVLPVDARRTARVRLTIVGEDQFQGSQVASVAVTDAGTFAIGGVPPGQYLVKVGTAEAWASQLISITDADVLDLRLLVHDPLQVSGRIVFDGSQSAPDAETAREVVLAVERADGRAISDKPVFGIDRNGRNFSIGGLMPGRYIVRMDRGPRNWFLRNVVLQGRDVSQTAFEVASGDVVGLTATLSNLAATVRGTVTGTADTSNVAVFLFPQDQQRWVDFGTGRRAFFAVDVRNGAFDVLGIPAGDYIAVALVADAQSAWRQPAFLTAASRVGTPVRVTEGGTSQADLRVVSIR